MEEYWEDHEEHQRTGCGEHSNHANGGLESISSISDTKGDP